MICRALLNPVENVWSVRTEPLVHLKVMTYTEDCKVVLCVPRALFLASA